MEVAYGGLHERHYVWFSVGGRVVGLTLGRTFHGDILDLLMSRSDSSLRT
jgi:hypothetical protein